MRSLWILILVALVGTASAQWDVGVCEQIEWSWDADSQLLRFHHDWSENCGVMAVTYEAEVAGGAITIREISYAMALAMCTCPYTGDVGVEGIAPGEYTVIWDHTLDCLGTPVEAITCDPFTIAVPEDATAGEPMVVDAEVAGCGLEVTAVSDPEPAVQTESWATIKGIFD